MNEELEERFLHTQLLVKEKKEQWYETVFIWGYFQILHANHLMYFNESVKQIAEKTKKQINEIFLVVWINNDLMAGKKYEKRWKWDIDFIPSNVRRFQVEQVWTVWAAFVLPETSLQTIQYGTTTIESEIYAVKLGVQHIIIPQQSVTNLDEERQDLINFFAANKITLELIDIDAFRIFYLKNGTRVSTTNIIDTILERF